MDRMVGASDGGARVPLLRAERVTRSFTRRGRAFDAVHEADFEVSSGEFVAVVGRSGNGKSTLINMVAGLVRPSSGRVLVDGRDVGELSDKELSRLRNRTVGFVTQSQTLLSNLTVLDNVILPATFFPEPSDGASDVVSDGASDGAKTGIRTHDGGASDDASDDVSDGAGEDSDPLVERACALLDRLGVADLAEEMPRDLSGGEMRRVCIARALMNGPRLLIADEPTGDLDDESTATVMRLLRECADGGMGVLMVTHDPDALGYADRVLRMDHGVLEELPRGAYDGSAVSVHTRCV